MKTNIEILQNEFKLLENMMTDVIKRNPQLVFDMPNIEDVTNIENTCSGKVVEFGEVYEFKAEEKNHKNDNTIL